MWTMCNQMPFQAVGQAQIIGEKPGSLIKLFGWRDGWMDHLLQFKFGYFLIELEQNKCKQLKL